MPSIPCSQSDKLFGLLDCNNFFVSCERVFQPKLEKRPVMVLSNNDGCVVSRSNEVKALNIKMGIPVFKLSDLIRQHRIQVFSSNFALYGDMSRRVMESLNELVPALEIYSIDEAFLDLSGFGKQELASFGKKIVQSVYQWTGIPISLGIGPTKTLAKVANHIAKKNPHYAGIFNIADYNQDKILTSISVGDIWGIGSKWAYHLNQLGIENAYQLSQQDSELLQKRFNSVLASTALELQGFPVFEIEQEIAPRKQIIVSRSFGKTVTNYPELKGAIVSHTTRALEKLRDQDSIAKTIRIFLQTSRFQNFDKPYHYDISIELSVPTSDTRAFIKAALQGLERLYHPGLHYKKAGVMLLDIASKESFQLDLFAKTDKKSESLMGLLDGVNGRIGQGTLRFALEGYKKAWQGRSKKRSPRFTTVWSELPIVRAS